MKAEQRKLSDIELENVILKIKTDILSLIVSDKSLTHIVHAIEDVGRKHIPVFWKLALYELSEKVNLKPEHDHGKHSQKFGLIFIDLDHFKWVNDSLRHDAGDRLLIQAAERIKATVGHDGVVARLGGDGRNICVLYQPSTSDEGNDSRFLFKSQFENALAKRQFWKHRDRRRKRQDV